MNIQQIKQLPAVDGWVDFNGQITKVGELKQRIKSQMSKTPGKQYNVIKLQIADNSDQIGVWAYADQRFLPNEKVTVRGVLKEFSNIRYIDYANVKSSQATGTSILPQAQEAIQQAAQRPNGKQEVSQDVWEGKDLRMARMNALNRAVELWLAGKTPFGDCSLLDTADLLVHYIYNGQKTTGLSTNERWTQIVTQPPAQLPDDEQIPF